MVRRGSNALSNVLLHVCQVILLTASMRPDDTFSGLSNNDLRTCLLLSLPSAVRTVYPCSTLPNRNSSQYQCDQIDVCELSSIRGGRISHSPAVIVFAKDTTDVQGVVKCAGKLNYTVNALTGGHSYEGYGLGSVYNNIIINIEAINYIHVNPYDGTGTFGAGARLGPIYYTAYQYNYTVNGGSCAWVGLAGQALGGGQGYLSRLYGLLSDNILEMKAVNAEGALLTINETHEIELYWALRGAGGGLFVIVTELKLRLVRPPSRVAIFASTWCSSASKLVIQHYQSLLFNDTTFNSDNNILLSMTINHVQVDVSINYFGTELEVFHKTISLLLAKLPTPHRTDVHERDWLTYVYERSSLDTDSGDCRQLLLVNLTYPTYYFKAKHLFYDQPIRDRSLDQFIEQLSAGYGQVAVQFSPWDGHLSTIPVDQTAFPHRHFKFGIQFLIFWDYGQNEQDQLDRLNDVYMTIYDDSTKYAYINYIDRDVPNWMDVYYHAHQQRLIDIKHIYDKNNRFYFERTIESNAIYQHIGWSIHFATFVTFLSFSSYEKHVRYTW